MHKYILNEHGEPERCDDLMKWATWFENVEGRVVRCTKRNGRKVSTIFLGLDHSFGDGPPIMWETMVFDDGSWSELDGSRHRSHEEAMAYHKEMVKKWLG